jgi:preprotein translocase subunit SecA
MNRQRELIYKERDKALFQDGLKEHIMDFVEDVVEDLIARYMHPDMSVEERDEKAFIESLNNKFGTDFNGTVKTVLKESHVLNVDWLRDDILKKVKEQYENREKEFGEERMRFLESYIMLQMIDSKWKEHLHGLDNLKEGIGLRAYGQRDPVIEYKKEAFDMFQGMVDSIKEDSVEFLFRVQSVREEEVKSNIPLQDTSYLHPESQGMNVAPEPKASNSNSQGSLLTGQGYNDAPPQQATTIKRDEPKVGRNDPCPCGSGKKHKKCCGKDD